MKGILIEPGKGPVVTTLPDTLQGIEAWLGGHADQKYFSRTPAILMHSAAGGEPNPHLARRGSLRHSSVLRLARRPPAAPEQGPAG